AVSHVPIPWRLVLTSRTVWLMGAVMTCGSFVAYLYFSWYPKYLIDARQIPRLEAGRYASLVLAGGVVGGILGGYLSDALVRWTGNRRWSRRGAGAVAFTLAALALLTGLRCDDPLAAVWWTSLAYLCAQVQLASWWAVVTEISGRHVGAMFGLMNSMGVP